jgi:hypothetical protein
MKITKFFKKISMYCAPIVCAILSPVVLVSQATHQTEQASKGLTNTIPYTDISVLKYTIDNQDLTMQIDGFVTPGITQINIPSQYTINNKIYNVIGIAD